MHGRRLTGCLPKLCKFQGTETVGSQDESQWATTVSESWCYKSTGILTDYIIMFHPDSVNHSWCLKNLDISSGHVSFSFVGGVDLVAHGFDTSAKRATIYVTSSISTLPDGSSCVFVSSICLIPPPLGSRQCSAVLWCWETIDKSSDWAGPTSLREYEVMKCVFQHSNEIIVTNALWGTVGSDPTNMFDWILRKCFAACALCHKKWSKHPISSCFFGHRETDKA